MSTKLRVNPANSTTPNAANISTAEELAAAKRTSSSQDNASQQEATAAAAAGVPPSMETWVDLVKATSGDFEPGELPFYKGVPMYYFHAESEQNAAIRSTILGAVMQCPNFVKGSDWWQSDQTAKDNTKRQIDEYFFAPDGKTFDGEKAAKNVQDHIKGCEICKKNQLSADRIPRSLNSSDQQSLQSGITQRMATGADKTGGNLGESAWKNMISR